MTAEITRRFVLGGLGSLLSAAAVAKPAVGHGGQGRGNPPPPGQGLSVRLDFADGKSLVFAQSQAMDIGDYVGPFVHQKCSRQIASGNGDYRDAFLVDFRPDADGKRQEVVVEFGTLFRFSAGSAPQTASGVAPVHIGIPPVARLSKIAGGTSAQKGTLTISLGYVTPEGESGFSKSNIILAVGDRVVVQSPPPSGNATHYNIYGSLLGTTPSSISVQQNAQPIPLGQSWIEPEAGVLLTGTPRPYKLPTTVAYRATISGGGMAEPITITVPMHYWLTRWRWQSSPRPIVRTHDDLVGIKAIMPLSAPLAYNAPIRPARAWAGPMDNGPLLIGMGTAGGRPDLGFMTEWAAGYLVTKDPRFETTMRAAAESTGTMPFWARDVATGALVDTSAHLYPAFNDASHGPHAIPIVLNTTVPNYFLMNQAHMPGAAFVPWLLTDDPYYLEGTQAAANYSILESNLQRSAEKLASLTHVTGTRGMAWGWRDIFQLAGFSLDVTPAWLLPRSHWRNKVLPDQLTFAKRFLDATASPCTTVFHLFPNTGSVPGFMLDYLCVVIGWIKWTRRFPEFDSVVEWAALPRVAMSDPSDSYGWDHRVPEPYYMPVFDARKGAAATGATQLGYKVPPSEYTPESWAELFQDYLMMAPAKKWPSDPARWPADGFAVKGSGYYVWIRSALAALALAGIRGAREGHDFTKRQLDADSRYASNGFTWAISAE